MFWNSIQLNLIHLEESKFYKEWRITLISLMFKWCYEKGTHDLNPLSYTNNGLLVLWLVLGLYISYVDLLFSLSQVGLCKTTRMYFHSHKMKHGFTMVLTLCIFIFYAEPTSQASDLSRENMHLRTGLWPSYQRFLILSMPLGDQPFYLERRM